MFQLPAWILSILQRYQAQLEAEEQLARMVAASTPYMKPEHRRRVISQYQRVAGSLEPKRETVIIEHDPEKARQWFETLGARAY